MIQEIHIESRGTYGWPRVHAELTLGLGEQVNRKRVARLMREAGIQGIYRRKGRRNLVNMATEEDLVHRQFTVTEPDRLWLTDITEHPARDGKVYCAAVMDAYSRRVIGWSIDIHLRTQAGVISTRHGNPPSESFRNLHDPAQRPRDAIHFLGIREKIARHRATRINGYRR